MKVKVELPEMVLVMVDQSEDGLTWIPLVAGAAESVQGMLANV